MFIIMKGSLIDRDKRNVVRKPENEFMLKTHKNVGRC